MSPRSALWLAWSLAALFAVLFVAGAILEAVSVGFASSSGTAANTPAFGATGAAFAVVGALVASRQPNNPIGWIFCAAAVAAGLVALSNGYAEFWLDGGPASTALGELAAVYHDPSWIPLVLIPATFGILLFPNGHLLSRRWRLVAWCAGLGTAMFLLAQFLDPEIQSFPRASNPYAIEGPTVDALFVLSAPLLLVALVGSPLSLIMRFRRAEGEERQQIKWLALAGTVLALAVVVGWLTGATRSYTVGGNLIRLSPIGLPLAAGVAILRYRLYDIDVVINRALVYGALTVTLAGAYLGSVLLLELALSGLTEGSGLAVAGSTLAVAALFRPARNRIQAAVDRRFFRRRYDAQRTLESFSARLRDQVDLTALDAELRGVVSETMQPAHVSLWVRDAPK